ncbi:MAG TPA: hypothetical protein VF458_16640 [Ktedonobacteraceae bacterium]
MNILIIGGLLGLAVLAILSAVLLGIGEDRAEKARREVQAQQTSTPALPFPQAQFPQVVSQGPAYQAVPATPILPPQTIPLPVSSQGQATGELSLADLNGQVREITGELRALAQRAGDLQQRLNTLSEALERSDRSSQEPQRTSAPADFFTSDMETQLFDR